MVTEPKQQPNATLRLRWCDTLFDALSEEAKLLISHYRQTGAGRAEFAYSLPFLPTSINDAKHLGSRGGWHNYVAPATAAFYSNHSLSLAGRRNDWKPKGTTAAVIVFEASKLWMTKEQRIRKADVDNRVKVLFDAISKTTDTDDCTHWSEHFFKLVGRRDATHVWLFDRGDLVTAHTART